MYDTNTSSVWIAMIELFMWHFIAPLDKLFEINKA